MKRKMTPRSKRKPGGHGPGVGIRIGAAMVLKRIKTKAELAQLIGRAGATVTNWFNGKTVPDTQSLEALKLALDVSPEFIERGVIPGRGEAGVLDQKIADLLNKVGPEGFALLADAPEGLAQDAIRLIASALGKPDPYEQRPKKN